MRTEFDFAHYHFVEVQNSVTNIDKALDMWAATVMESGGDAPWTNSDDLYKTIDAIQHGDAPWKMYHIQYCGPQPPVLHHQLVTKQFKDKINLIPYLWLNLMSADWAWSQVDEIAKDVSNHGAMFVPIVAGSDKTTVSVATGHQEYHPVYMSPGNLTNIACHPRNTDKPPSSRHSATNVPCFPSTCIEPLKDRMTTPEVVKCPDGHFRCAIYGLVPYIADYPEQVWLAGIIQGWCPKCTARPENLDAPGAQRRTQTTTNFLISTWDPGILWTDFGVCADILLFTHGFPHADIHDLLTPDLLHQVIKGTFKDHLQARAHAIIEDIDRRISAVPPFLGLRRFPDGRDFVQWTGDDSKALMKVYLTAIAGHVPSEMDALTRFHHHQKVFIGTAGVNGDQISLPRQHALIHYLCSIQLFSSPNGLCSSITNPNILRLLRSHGDLSRYNALKQMLLGMMEGTTSSYTAMILRGELPQLKALADGNHSDDDDDDDIGPVHGPKSLSSIKLARTPKRGYPRAIKDLAVHIGQLRFPELICRFLYNQLNLDSDIPSTEVDLEDCPCFNRSIYVYHSAIAHFYAPSDLCGAGGMYQECIQSNPNWREEYARRDTILAIGCALLFFHLHSMTATIPDTGLWVVRPEFGTNGRRTLAIIHLDCVARAAHLLPIYSSSFIPEDFHFLDALDVFCAYFVNRHIDHHSHDFIK
ncbi:hypothetical protein BJV74DRAFT_911363 [Russula compacta]|nr:hypothetical protein BJV74DRAFT_911363 [Russula compacta]